MDAACDEIVLLLELAASQNWTRAFFFPFENIKNFRPKMEGHLRTLTCLMNLKRCQEEKLWPELEDTFLKIESIPQSFIEIQEVEDLAEFGMFYQIC